MPKRPEYRVRAVTKWIVTEYQPSDERLTSGGSTPLGTYDNVNMANFACNSFAEANGGKAFPIETEA